MNRSDNLITAFTVCCFPVFNCLCLSLPLGKTRRRSDREVRGAGLILQKVWGYKELRRTLEKDGWKKTDFMINLNPSNNNPKINGETEESSVPLIDKGL